MKQAIAYIRISDKDQSNFSLAGQEKYIRDHCAKNNFNLMELFTEDGKSAKNFERPDWKRLELFIKNHKHNVHYLIVVKYDRFSRNAAQGLHKIEMLEKKYGIIIISVFEQMFIDYDSPFFFKQRADMLVNAEFEWHVIRDRTRFGMHNALSSGRYVSKAPIGYINAKDEHKKPLLLIDENKATLIRNIFNQYLGGLPFINIQKNANTGGLKLKGRSAVPRILNNCIYAGLVNVPAYRKEPTKYVKGLHEAIIEESVWWNVQHKIGNTPRIKTSLNEKVHLRGFLQCSCGALLTAGESKGKYKYYWYYKCNQHKANHSVIKLHQQFNEVLSYFSLTKLQLNYLHQSAEKQMRLALKERTIMQSQTEREWKQAVQQLESLEEKFIRNEISSNTYQRWYNTYKSNEATLRFNMEQLNNNADVTWKAFTTALPRLQDIKFLYNAAKLDEKHIFLKHVFNSGLSYDDGAYRTPTIISLFRHNELILKEKRLLIIEQPFNKLAENSESAPPVTTIELLAPFFHFINAIKTA